MMSIDNIAYVQITWIPQLMRSQARSRRLLCFLDTIGIKSIYLTTMQAMSIQ